MNLWATKSVTALRAEAEATHERSLKRALGAMNLTMLGIGAIIGAGITGLTAAILLKQRGKTVAVIEKERVGGGETGNTTAHITEAIDARYYFIARVFSKDASRLVAQASRASQALVDRGLVAKRPSENDARSVVLSLTPRGRKLWGAVMELITQRNNEIFGCLTPAERKQLGRMLDRLIEHARPQYP